MRRFIYCVVHVLSSPIVSNTLLVVYYSLGIYLSITLALFLENKKLHSVIFSVIFYVIFLASLFLGSFMSVFVVEKITVWLRQEDNFKLQKSLWLAIINSILITYIYGLLIQQPSANISILEKLTTHLKTAPPPIPEFPIPAPPASATIVLPSYFFDTKIKANDETIYLKDIAQTLNISLISAGYFERSYFAVTDGFVIVTRLEQINFDGTPKQGSERWATVVKPLRKFSLREYLQVLFTANPGYYRIIVFIVTPHPFSQTAPEINRDEAEAWLREGVNALPKSIGQQVYSSYYTTTALIYEFEQPSGFEQDKVNIIIPGRLDAKSHLLKAGLWNALEK